MDSICWSLKRVLWHKHNLVGVLEINGHGKQWIFKWFLLNNDNVDFKMNECYFLKQNNNRYHSRSLSHLSLIICPPSSWIHLIYPLFCYNEFHSKGLDDELCWIWYGDIVFIRKRALHFAWTICICWFLSMIQFFIR